MPDVKRARLEIDHLALTNAEVKNEWSYTSTPPLCHHGINRDYSVFLFINFEDWFVIYMKSS
jgi:hypothetical protein